MLDADPAPTSTKGPPQSESLPNAPLQIQGLIDSEWGHSANNRRARYYRLTRAGRRALGEAESSFERLIAAIGRVMRPA